MSRPWDWSPLAGADPVPGDPDELSSIARSHRETARTLREQADRLRALSNDASWDSDAADTWRVRGRRVASQLLKVEERYEVAGSALRAYAGELRSAQSRSRSALGLAQDAERRLLQAERALEDLARAADRAPEGSPPPDDSHLRRAAQDARTDLSTARSDLESAVRDRDAAAERAARSINRIVDEDGASDGRFAGARKWAGDRMQDLNEALDDIVKWAGVIATAAGLLALAVGWIPIVGQMAAAVLTAVALLATLVSLVGNLALVSQGRTGWSAIGIDLFALATFGVGRAAVAGVRLGARGQRAVGQAARQDELASRAVAARGGSVSPKARRKIDIKARRDAKAEGGLTRAEVDAGVARAPRSLPSPLDVARAANPLQIGRDVRAAYPVLRDPDNWRDARTAWEAGRRGPGLLDDAARRELDLAAAMPATHRAAPEVAAQSGATRRQLEVLYGATGAGVTSDGADKLGLLDGTKRATTLAQ